MKSRLFSYNFVDTLIHRLSGLTKMVCFLLLTSAVMLSFDIRFILGVLIFSLIILILAKIKFSQIRAMVIYVFVFVLINVVLTFLFSPEEGVGIYGTRHEIAHLFGRYNLTQEQLLYQTTLFFKYFSVIPLGIVFLLTTDPSEFSSALNRIKVPYKAAFALALTLRYFPDIQREYTDISLAQQARGLDLSHKAPVKDRFKNSLLIIIPLIFSSLERIEVVSNAMDLRGFGKAPTRTWFVSPRIGKYDIIAIVIATIILSFSIVLTVWVNHSRFYNPFI